MGSTRSRWCLCRRGGARADERREDDGRRAREARAPRGWDDAASDPAARAKREADIAAECGVDLRRLGRERAAQEALTSVFC